MLRATLASSMGSLQCCVGPTWVQSQVPEEAHTPIALFSPSLELGSSWVFCISQPLTQV